MKNGTEQALQETAQNLLANLSHAKNDPSILLFLGNRIVEEGNLLGGPFADLAINFGEILAAEGVKRIVENRKRETTEPL